MQVFEKAQALIDYTITFKEGDMIYDTTNW